jgi:hypothetical protein
MELCCAIHMALAEEPAFRNLNHLLKAGPVLTRVKLNLGGCEGGFNYRNTYPRKTSMCPDTVRKYFRATDPEKLCEWFHGPILGWFRRKRAFSKGRIFAMDSTYVVVPENEHYEHTARMPLDDHHQLVDTSGLSEEEKKRVRYVPCYKLTYLLHLGEEPSGKPQPHTFTMIPAFRLGPGNDDSHEHDQTGSDENDGPGIQPLEAGQESEVVHEQHQAGPDQDAGPHDAAERITTPFFFPVLYILFLVLLFFLVPLARPFFCLVMLLFRHSCLPVFSFDAFHNAALTACVWYSSSPCGA